MENKPKLSDVLNSHSYVWCPPSVDVEPRTKLVQWKVVSVKGNFRDQGDTTHFIGYCGEGRVSSPVLEFNAETMTGRTRSGRIYELVGEPGCNRDAMYVFSVWVDGNGNPEVTDITEAYQK